MTRKSVTDEQYGQLSRRLGELLRRVDEGTIPFARAFADAQLLVEGKTFQPHIIDYDADPYLPADWKGVEYHKKGGMFEWNPAKVYLHLSPNQQNGKTTKGNNLRKELKNEPVLNANVLDYLLDHPELIPEEWKDKAVFFWGTIYRNSDGSLCVRYLVWRGSQWDWRCRWLGHDWRSCNPAACSPAA